MTLSDTPRKKSPRAPSMALHEAIEKGLRIYDKERRHSAPTDVIAQNLGYKSANNGAALAAIASLRYFGLLEKAQEGKLAVSKDIEMYKFAPSEELKSELQIKWLKSPPVFADLLEKYGAGLPSDATIRFDLINAGFNPVSAESVINVFKQSVEFAKYFERQSPSASVESSDIGISLDAPSSLLVSTAQVDGHGKDKVEDPVHSPLADHDRIPVRLSGGRRAWLEIPTPFFSADKKRLKSQIDLLLTEDEEESGLG